MLSIAFQSEDVVSQARVDRKYVSELCTVKHELSYSSNAGANRIFAKTYFLCRQGAHDSGTRFRLRTTLNWSCGDLPLADEPVEGEVKSISDVLCDIILCS